MRYTNIVSDLIRSSQGPVAARIRQVGESNIATSIVVAAELRYGAAKKGSERLTAQVQSVLDALEVLPLEAPVDHVYGVLRTHQEKNGHIVGANGLLIAAQAISLGLTLVSATSGSSSGSGICSAKTGFPKRFKNDIFIKDQTIPCLF